MSCRSKAGDTHQKLVTETGNGKFDASSSQFLAPKEPSSQSRCTVYVTWCTVFCDGIEPCSIPYQPYCTRKNW